MRPDFVAVGHIARDITEKSVRIGGTVAYGSFTALRMGLRPAIVTSVGPDIDTELAVPGIPAHVIESTQTTCFHNSYDRGVRHQLLTSVAMPIAQRDVPTGWRDAPLVLLGPLAGEVSCGLARAFPNSLVVASLQGWLRQRDSRGNVRATDWDGREVLPFVHAAVVSIGDVRDMRQVDEWSRMAPVLIVTMGPKGSRIHFDGKWHHVEAFEAREVDPTGAGDVFAAAYLVRYHETSEPLEAARYASCAASFSVEATGIYGVPQRRQVEERLARPSAMAALM